MFSTQQSLNEKVKCNEQRASEREREKKNAGNLLSLTNLLSKYVAVAAKTTTTTATDSASIIKKEKYILRRRKTCFRTLK